MKLLNWIQKNLVITIPVTMALGFLYGLNAEASFLRKIILPLTFLMVYPMMVTLPLKKITERGDGKVQLTAQIINFAVIPFIAFGLGRLFFADNQLMAVGLLLTGLLPTSGMTISWTGIAKGNMAAAVKMTVIGLLAGSMLTPVYLKMLMGTAVEVDLLGIFQQIAVVVILPLIAGNITQRLLIAKYGPESYQKEIKKKIPPFSTLGVIGIVFVAMALKSRSIAANPAVLIKILIPLVILYGVNFSVSTLIGKRFFNRGNGIALLYGTVMRNLSIALAIAISSFERAGADIALVIAVGFIVQVQMSAWLVRLTGKIFGAPEGNPVKTGAQENS